MSRNLIGMKYGIFYPVRENNTITFSVDKGELKGTICFFNSLNKWLYEYNLYGIKRTIVIRPNTAYMKWKDGTITKDEKIMAVFGSKSEPYTEFHF